MEGAALVALLAPVLGYLLKAGETAADEAARALGGEAWGYAKRLWAKLRGGVEGRPAALEAAQDVAARPEDERARAALELQLEKVLAADPELAREVVGVLGEARAAGVVAVGERSVAVSGDVGGTIVTGDQNVVRE